ncbi:peptidase M23-like protein [Compostimonas suwonensis]|uniref:Peptidase M23-like protein n=2 Tax=Compostimonas suwonensis TaxID=1048394 RepID=A0A2M9BZT2_9MICO|nr:peptidase M23-like protein [Compostimonas suwonensis]
MLGAGSATAETPSAPGGGERPTGTDVAAAGTPWLWPLDGRNPIVRGFEAPPHPYGAGHRGIDIAATPGQLVRAPAAGTVSFAGVVVDRGVLSIAHPGGLVSSYEPVETQLAEGRSVSPGEAIATIDGTSHCGSSCLHLGVRLDGEYVSPLLLLGGIERAVLLPVVPAR